MLRIDPRQAACTVIVTVDAAAEVMDELVVHARAGLELFRDCKSYRAGAVHVSTDRTRLVQYSQWDDEAGYERCRDDERWERLESTSIFMDHVRAGRATVDARAFDVVDSSHT